jgi:hypothetical protein
LRLIPDHLPWLMALVTWYEWPRLAGSPPGPSAPLPSLGMSGDARLVGRV